MKRSRRPGQVRSGSALLMFETHATSLDNEAGLASGWYDVDLSPLGEAQARDLGQRYLDKDLAAVFCSDLRRSHRTAEVAFSGLPVPIVRDRRLRECDYGALTRRPVAEVEAKRLESIKAPFPGGGESYEQVTRRVSDCVAEIAARHPQRSVLVIGHRATFYALEHLLKGRALDDVVAAPWRWQPGWSYPIPAGFRS